MNSRPAVIPATAAAGLLMVAATLPGASVPAMVAAGVALLLVLISLLIRSVATGAVLAVVVALAIGSPLAASAVLTGLAATAFLLLSALIDAPTGVAIMTRQTLTGAVVFAAIGLVATALPLELRWAPVAAPVLVVAIFAISLTPYVAATTRRPGSGKRGWFDIAH